jgi:hypothetical protein
MLARMGRRGFNTQNGFRADFLTFPTVPTLSTDLADSGGR